MRESRRPRLAAGRIALLPPAAFAVHQLRYELTYGSHTGAELRETGHSYLHSVVPWLVALIALSFGTFLWGAGRALATRTTPRERSLSFVALWSLCAAALVAIFACQETLEGIFATGHPQGWAAVFGDGGWWAVPVAVCVGLLLAALLRGARWVVRHAAQLRRAGVPTGARPRAAIPAPHPVFMLAPAPLLAGWSNRGPPSLPGHRDRRLPVAVSPLP